MKFSDEIKELHEMYRYMKDEGFPDSEFIRSAENLVESGVYAAKSLAMMRSIHNISANTIVASTVTRKRPTKTKTITPIKPKPVVDVDPCGRGIAINRSHC